MVMIAFLQWELLFIKLKRLVIAAITEEMNIWTEVLWFKDPLYSLLKKYLLWRFLETHALQSNNSSLPSAKMNIDLQLYWWVEIIHFLTRLNKNKLITLKMNLNLCLHNTQLKKLTYIMQSLTLFNLSQLYRLPHSSKISFILNNLLWRHLKSLLLIINCYNPSPQTYSKPINIPRSLIAVF